MKVAVAMSYGGDAELAKTLLTQFGNATDIQEICGDSISVVAEVDEAYKPVLKDAFAIENRRLIEGGHDKQTFTLAWGEPAARAPVVA